jgi:uncharacterized repeat protein (TIGR01451 family)/CSLREA domain-containing protein
MRYLILSGILTLLPFIGSQLPVAPSQAGATITVTTTSDAIAASDGCSLREAIIAANTDSAVNDCPAGSGADTIAFSPALPQPATFSLTNTGAGEDGAATGDLDIAGILTIDGAGSDSTLFDGNGTDRVLEILPGARVTINGARIYNGNPGSGAGGGGVAIDATARLTLTNSLVSSNTAAGGGGVKVHGLLILNDSQVEENQGGGVSNDAGLLIFNNVDITSNSGGYAIDNRNGAWLSFSGGTVSGNQGGGIYNETSIAELSNLDVISNTLGGGIHSVGTTSTRLTLSNAAVVSNTATSGAGILNDGIGAVATINDTRIGYNVASAGGGGINNHGSLTLVRTTIDHNQARSGGGIDHSGFSLEATNVTLSSNVVSDNGGGLYNRTSAKLTNVTLQANAASGVGSGGNIFNDGDTAHLSIVNTIVASAGGGGNCVNSNGVLDSLGHNLESTDTCSFTATSDITDADPALGSLKDNGGATWTHALSAGSPAVDAGDPSACPDTDQRGVPRPQGTSCDIGSYELIVDGQTDLSVSKVDAVDPVTVGDTIVYTVTVKNGGPDAALGVRLTDSLPSGVSFTSAVPDQGSCGEAGGTVSCTLGDVPSGASADVAIAVVTTPTSAGAITNTVTVTSATADPNPADNDDTEQTTVKAWLPHRVYLPLVTR